MSKPINSFRSQKYFRSKFQEGKYLLSSEATDLQLESFDQVREYIKHTYGDVCVESAFRLDKINSTTAMVRPGEAWCDGLPFLMKSGTDTVVNGGTLPSYTTIADSSASISDIGGKLITINVGGTTPSSTYGIVIEATEELIKGSGSPAAGIAIDTFLVGENVFEDTAIKSRLIYKIHMVPYSALITNPTYSASPLTNHYMNEIIITPDTTATKLNSTTTIAMGNDGENCELVFLNSDKKLPYTNSTDTQEYVFGKLVDSDGNIFTILSISSSDSGAHITMKINREPDIASASVKATIPIITNGVPFRLIKRDHYVTNTTGTIVPTGKRYLLVGTAVVTASTISTVTDLRNVIYTNGFSGHNHDGTHGEASIITPTNLIVSDNTTLGSSSSDVLTINATPTAGSANVIANARTRVVTTNGTDPGIGGVSISADTGIGTTSSNSSWESIPNLSVTLTTTGRPVVVSCIGTNSTYQGSFFITKDATNSNRVACSYRFMRGATQVGFMYFLHFFDTSTTALNLGAAIPSSSFHIIDCPPAGTHTYQCQSSVVALTGTNSLVMGTKLVAYEI